MDVTDIWEPVGRDVSDLVYTGVKKKVWNKVEEPTCRPMIASTSSEVEEFVWNARSRVWRAMFEAKMAIIWHIAAISGGRHEHMEQEAGMAEEMVR